MSAEKLLAELNKLPMQQGAATRVLSLLEQPDSSAEELARVIETDPALSARVLRLANSPFFARGSEVASAARAVFVLGLSVVRSLAVSTAAGLFESRARSLPPGFWEHSVASAAGATTVARRAGVDRGDAFSAALLHDLGEALMRRHAPAEYGRIAGLIGERPGDRIEIERQVLGGLSHADVGAIALGAWSLPERLVTAVREHHAPPGATDELTGCVTAGDALADRVLDDGCPHQGGVDLDAVLAGTGVRGADLDALLVETTAELETLRAALGGAR